MGLLIAVVVPLLRLTRGHPAQRFLAVGGIVSLVPACAAFPSDRLLVLSGIGGSGLVAIAAALSGAAEVTAADIDPFCAAAVRLNAAANGVAIGYDARDRVGADAGWDIVLAGDVFYDKPFADRLMPWFDALRKRGADILVGDPGRSYLPESGLTALATYEVPVTRALEDAEVKRTTVWRVA